MLSVRRERSGNVLLLIPTPRPTISTPSNTPVPPSLPLSFYFFDQDTPVPVPYSALIDRERYTKLACIEVPETSHSLKRNFLFSWESTKKKKRIGKRSSFPTPRWFLSLSTYLFRSPILISTKRNRTRKEILMKRSKFFNSNFIPYIIFTAPYFFPKIYSRKTIPISEREDCLAY